jgi:hypothetical protein
MFARLFAIFFTLFAVGTFSPATETYFEVLDSETNSVFGTIVSLDRTQIVVDVQGDTQTIPLEKVVKIRNLASSPYEGSPSATGYQNLVRLSPPAERTVRSASERRLDEIKANIKESNAQTGKKTFPSSVVALDLKDGSRLTASSFTITNSRGICRLLDQQNDLSIPLDNISAVRFTARTLLEVINPPADWLRLAVLNTEGDRLIVGSAGAFDVYAGILHHVNADTISFDVDGEVLPVPRRKVFGLVLHGEPGASAGAPPLAALTLWTGTRGMISDIQLKDNGLTWTTTNGLTVTVPLNMVNDIDFGEKGFVSLFDFERVRNEFSFPFASDIKLEQSKLLQTFYESRTKASREIMLDGIAYDRGITLLGRSVLEYHLPKPFVTLKAVIGIEDQFRPYASATLQILADSQVLGTWELRGDTVAQRIHCNLPQNCRLLTIIAEPLPQSGVPAVLTIADPKLFE